MKTRGRFNPVYFSVFQGDLFCIRHRAAPPDHPRWGRPHAWDQDITVAPSGERNYWQPRVDSCGCWPERQVAPDFPFAAKPHPRALENAPRAPRVLADTPYPSPKLVHRVRGPQLEVFTCPDMGSRCILGRWQILRSFPHSAAPPNRRRWGHHSTQSSTWAVPCACACDSNCFPPLRAAKAQATWSQKLAPAKTCSQESPHEPFPRPPHSASLEFASPAWGAQFQRTSGGIPPKLAKAQALGLAHPAWQKSRAGSTGACAAPQRAG